MSGHFAVVVERLQRGEAKVVIIGQGELGLPIAMRASRLGHSVVGFDHSATRVETLRQGRSTVAEISDDEVGAALATGYEPTGDPRRFSDFDIAVIAPPTGDAGGRDDLGFFPRAGMLLLPDVRRGVCIIVERTLFPGTAIAMLHTAFREGTRLAEGDYALGYAPDHPAWADPLGITSQAGLGDGPDGRALATVLDVLAPDRPRPA